MADVARYLLPSERAVIDIRQHWAVLAGATLQSIALFAIGVLLVRFSNGVDAVRTAGVFFCFLVVLRWSWKVWEWSRHIVVVTDKRLLLVTGIVTRNLAIMPLVKVTDLTFHRSSTGLLLGYGKFVVESAGQDQALSTIDYVPRAEATYLQISELLFGGDKGAPGAMVTAAQYEASEEEERQARSRWRRFASVRRRGRGWTAPPDQTDGPPEPSPATNRLDDLLARRDTLLAEEDERYEFRDRDRGRDFDRDFDRDVDREEQLPERRRRSDDTWELPRIHEPGSRNSGSYDNGFDTRRIDPQLPPPRRPRDAGSDPADD